MRRSAYAQADLLSPDIYDRNLDIFANDYGLITLSGQHQHPWLLPWAHQGAVTAVCRMVSLLSQSFISGRRPVITLSASDPCNIGHFVMKDELAFEHRGFDNALRLDINSYSG